ncbi:hypothetical protein NN3_57510 [Nocardia neocaledoniensis NBRC 108232]|uniref:Uncharacterized protein n=1 Tax=Nocardia neocaledoniensis TaxID=236511 RepID=A0A317P0K5_9NOCA|nr:hypothetical protein [Nocardia neocaledoniensis]PWV80682.1 hypothetical protein DFR69_10118 [Nocardia neocaledoniensis]GEM34744.1 hypothetical protein NN3_57510 [Nocardia neocaledoniensis NBRC 108232]
MTAEPAPRPGYSEAVWGCAAALVAVPAGALGGGVAFLLCWAGGVAGCALSVTRARRAGMPIARQAVVAAVISVILTALLVVGVVALLRGEMPPG